MTGLAKILLVDDDEDILLFYSEVLSELGHVEVTLASNGQEALDRLSQSDFDLVITDICMPKISGIELVIQIQKKSQHQPILVLTGNQDTLSEARNLKVHGFLEKPCRVSQMVDMVEVLLLNAKVG